MSSPPIETPRGWLMIYHGVRRTPSNSIYRLGPLRPRTTREVPGSWRFLDVSPRSRLRTLRRRSGRRLPLWLHHRRRRRHHQSLLRRSGFEYRPSPRQHPLSLHGSTPTAIPSTPTTAASSVKHKPTRPDFPRLFVNQEGAFATVLKAISICLKKNA